MAETKYHSASGSSAEDLFIELFCDTFGAEKAGYLYSQFHFYDIYQNDRFADFFLENGSHKIAFEIDDEASHNKNIISQNKFYDDLLKQNSMVHLGWDVYRWAVQQMDMSYSYKPVLIKAIMRNADAAGRVKIDDITAYFRYFYEARRQAGLTVERPNSIFAKGGYTDKEAANNILSNPFKRFQDMQMLRHTKTLGIIEVEPTVWKNLTDSEKEEILQICDDKLEKYYRRSFT